MGITGLLPFLEKSSKKASISDFKGKTVAVDSYCWLHRGAFSCAEKLSMGQPTDAYVKYCMKYVNMLVAAGVKPILVFDGRHLPAKKETEGKRRESRDMNRKRAAELLQMGKTFEGRNILRRSLDVTHKMALELIKSCQKINVDCIVAPYEADAQLAYLSMSGIADVIITEDSDLVLFGCKNIFFKMDLVGNGVLVEHERLHLAMGIREEHFDMDKFRYMCILSGCDYLASLPGIGLNKACKFVLKLGDCDIQKALPRLGMYLNKRSLTVTTEYIDAFFCALVTFKHQLVYCPLKRKQVRLHEPTPEVTQEQLKFAGDKIDEKMAYQLALGNYDPFTLKQLHDFDPDKSKKLGPLTRVDCKVTKHVSIWSVDFKVKHECSRKEKAIIKMPDTAGKVVVLKPQVGLVKKENIPKKRSFEETEPTDMPPLAELLKMYTHEKCKVVKTMDTLENLGIPETTNVEPENNQNGSPVRTRRTNPFLKKSDSGSPSLLHNKKRGIIRFRPTIITENASVQSKFFASKINEDDKKEEEEENTKVKEQEKNYEENEFDHGEKKEKEKDCQEQKMKDKKIADEIENEENENSKEDLKLASSFEVNCVMMKEKKLSGSRAEKKIGNEHCAVKDEDLNESVDFLDVHRNEVERCAQESNDAGVEMDFCVASDDIMEGSQEQYKFEDSMLNVDERPPTRKKMNPKKPSIKRYSSSKKLDLIKGQSRLNMFGFQRNLLK